MRSSKGRLMSTNSIRSAILCTLCALALFLPTSLVAAQPKVVAYVPNWIDLATFAETIDYAKLTHINVAFENPRNAAGDMSFNRKDTGLMDQRHPKGIKGPVLMGGG